MKQYFYSIPTFTSSTWALLAFTRFILAFIVITGHGHLDKFTNVGMPLSVIREFGGRTAVMVFLIISGVSVGYSFMKSKKGFLKRRFLRIYPLYFVAIMGTIFLQYYLGSPYAVKDTNFIEAGVLTSISNLFLLQGIISLPIMFNGPVWSISVEFSLYLILPFLFLLRLRYIYLVALLSIVAYIVHASFWSTDLYGVQHIIYAWPFIIGFLVAVKKQFWGVLPLILLGAFGMFYNHIMEVVSEPFAYLWFLLTAFLIIYILYVKIQLPDKLITVFNYLGTISYPMYLFHIPFYFIFFHIGIREDLAFVSLAILLCIPFNYIFDDLLLKIFWKPLVCKIESFSYRITGMRTQIIPKKI